MSDKVFIATGDISTPIDFALLSQYKRDVKPGAIITVRIDLPYEAAYRVMNTIRKVLSGISLIPTIDLMSHAEVAAIVLVARELCVSDEKLCSGAFAGWTANRRWMLLENPECMYIVWQLVEELVDFRKYFRLAKDPFGGIMPMVNSPLYDSETLINALIHFTTFEFEQCFDMNNDEVQKELVRLRKARTEFLQDARVLVAPHHHARYAKYTPPVESAAASTLWSCDGISTTPSGAMWWQISNLADYDTALMRFREFTCGVFAQPTHAQPTPFPWESVIFAGGSISKILDAHYDRRNARASDVDMFIVGRTFEERKATFDKVIAYFTAPDTYFAVRGSVISIYRKNVPRRFQIISSNAKTIADVLHGFDLSHVQWALTASGSDFAGASFYGTARAMKALRERVTRFCNCRSIKPVRLVKALLNGYSIERSPAIIEKIIDITPLVEDPKGAMLQDIIREIGTYYLPRDMPDYEPEELQQYILAMVCKDALADLVTNDPEVARKNATISGDFTTSYESINFKTFNPALIHNLPGRRTIKTIMRSKHGAIRLTTDFCEVVRISTDEDGIKITVKISPEFAEFIRLLEGNVYRMVYPAGSNQKLSEGGEVTIAVPQYVIVAQAAKGFSIIRDQRGNPLNIEEDLLCGDKIQFMFLTELYNIRETRGVSFKPLRFVKYSAAVTEHVENVDTIEDIEGTVKGVDDENIPTTLEYE
jgi:hypothetical protein